MNIILNRKLDFDKTLTNYRKVLWFYDLWSRLTESKAFKKVFDLADVKDCQSKKWPRQQVANAKT